MEQDILQGLNAAQRTAVTSEAEVLQVLAPPGSGKTKTLTARVAYLVAHRQLQPWNIIVCTFTVKAASEMKERITTCVGHEISRKLNLGTFHSTSLRYLKTYGQHIGLPKDFGIADTSDSKSILKRIIKKHGMAIEPGPALGRISSRKSKGDTDARPENAKKTVEQQEFQQLFDEYEATLAASNLLDFDDILLRCCFLLKSHPQCVSNVQAVLIDEFQDTNNIQYELMRLFAQQSNIITIVGDPDQSIYGWRSAEIKNLSRMKTRWPDTLTINLEENYRSSGAILKAAENIIEQDESRPPKKLQATHSYGLRPVLRKLPSATAEAEWLVSEIKRMRALSGNMIQPSDFAILVRSATLSRVIETALGSNGMLYRMVGGTKFYDRAEVKLVVDYLRVIHQPEHSEAVERVVNNPPRKVGEATIKGLREEAEAKDVCLWTLILDIAQGRCSSRTKITEPTRKGLCTFVDVILSGQKKVGTWTAEQPSLVDLINLVIQKIKLQAYLKSKDDDTCEARWSNVEELIIQAADAMTSEKLNEFIDEDGLPVIEDLEQRAESVQDVLSIFLNNIALTSSTEQKAEASGEPIQQVTISTIHAAKGLEWPIVFIPACYDGSIPHSRADDHDEERRLLYVGMTRAQALLYMSCPIKNTQREDTCLSSFLTHKGATRFFEEHGPSLSSSGVTNLSVTLRRQRPTDAEIATAKQSLQSDEDNYWPLNGEEVFQESSRWDSKLPRASLSGFGNARAAISGAPNNISMQQQQGFSTASSTITTSMGFTSVASRYDELMEQASLQKVDKRTEANDTATQPVKGRKRQIEGQGSIASFFGKKSKPEPPAVEATKPATFTRPLHDISRSVENRAEFRPTIPQAKQHFHKPRSTPMSTRPVQNDSNDSNQYLFLPSSPMKPTDDEGSKESEMTDSGDTSTFMRPATTFHTTSMANRAPQRKTLGTRRSLNGWPPKGRSGGQ